MRKVKGEKDGLSGAKDNDNKDLVKTEDIRFKVMMCKL